MLYNLRKQSPHLAGPKHSTRRTHSWSYQTLNWSRSRQKSKIKPIVICCLEMLWDKFIFLTAMTRNYCAWVGNICRNTNVRLSYKNSDKDFKFTVTTNKLEMSERNNTLQSIGTAFGSLGASLSTKVHTNTYKHIINGTS